MRPLYDVIIAGSGPIGLFLACELAMSNISVIILERDAHRESKWKTMPLGLRGMNTQAIEALYRRGLLGEFFDLDQRKKQAREMMQQHDPSQGEKGFRFGGHFAGIPLDASKLDVGRWKYRIPGPAYSPGPTTIAHIEEVLTRRAESLGVEIVRGCGVARVVQQHDEDENNGTEEVVDDSGVTVVSEDGRSFRGRWLVGCDGGRSMVRKSAGFDFVGTEAKFTGYAIQCDVDRPEKLKPGFHNTRAGQYIVGKQGALYLVDFDNGAFDRSKEIKQEHVQGVLNRVTGIADLKITAMHLASAFTDRSKQATKYRKGRVLLAGDAAHIHPPLGSQGLNLGLADAMNLGWKLAATIQQESSSGGYADLALLDTYESERHPVAAWVLEWTRAQVVTIQPDLYGQAVQTLLRDLIDTTDGTNLFINRVWGLSQRYSLGDDETHAHRLVGSSAPDFELQDGTRLGSKLNNSGRGLLLNLEGNAALKNLIDDGDYGARLDYLSMDAKDRRGLGAMLIRPDGIVAWVVEEGTKPDTKAAEAALKKWFGW